MKEVEYSEAATQVLDILNYTRQEDVKKIPLSFINFLNNISNKQDTPKFNHEYPISALNLTKKAKELLGFIYITWWCDESERKKYKDIIHSNNIKPEEITNYDVNDIFKKKIEMKTNITNDASETSIIEYKKENLFKRTLNKLLSFFGNKNEGSNI